TLRAQQERERDGIGAEDPGLRLEPLADVVPPVVQPELEQLRERRASLRGAEAREQRRQLLALPRLLRALRRREQVAQARGGGPAEGSPRSTRAPSRAGSVPRA